MKYSKLNKGGMYDAIMKYMAGGKYMKEGGTGFGNLSVKAGIDENPEVTYADKIAGAKMNEKGKGGRVYRMGGVNEMGHGGVHKYPHGGVHNPEKSVEEKVKYNLSEFLPKKPSEQELKVMKEMFEASVDGRPYDADRWGAYYRPAGVNAPVTGNAPSTSADTPAPATDVATPPVTEVKVEAPAPQPAPEPVAQADGASKGSKAEDILAMIRSRQNKQ